MTGQGRPVHPLAGADLLTLARALLGNGGIARRHLPEVALVVLAVLARSPFSAGERVFAGRKISRAGPMPPPVFIVGHWRSGTTHLYNVMSRDPGLGFVPPLAAGLPWDLFGLATWFRPLLERALPKHRWIDAMTVTPDSPQEDELALACMTTLSFYHGIYFPQHLRRHFGRGVFFDGCSPHEVERWRQRHVHLLQKLHARSGGRRLLIKNPVYSARIPLLREVWPGARFIHIHRNPYLVFPSMRNFWARLLETFGLQEPGEGADDRFVLENYARMMAILERDRQALPEDAWVELRLDEFEREPLGALARIYRKLQLPEFERARPHFEAELARAAGYQVRRWPLPERDRALVDAHLGAILARFGYDPPAA